MLTLNSIYNYTAGAGCVPTALAAVTGLSLPNVAHAVSVAAKTKDPTSNSDGDICASYNINDWLSALWDYGISATECAEWHLEPYQDRPTFGNFLSGYVPDVTEDVFLMFAERSVVDKELMTHVFSVQGPHIVDTWTGGQKILIGGSRVPPDFNEFRMKRAFRLELR